MSKKKPLKLSIDGNDLKFMGVDINPYPKMEDISKFHFIDGDTVRERDKAFKESLAYYKQFITPKKQALLNRLYKALDDYTVEVWVGDERMTRDDIHKTINCIRLGIIDVGD